MKGNKMQLFTSNCAATLPAVIPSVPKPRLLQEIKDNPGMLRRKLDTNMHNCKFMSCDRHNIYQRLDEAKKLINGQPKKLKSI